MPNIEKIHIEGGCATTNPGSSTIEIPLPQLPAEGAWSITGTVLAFKTGAASQAAADSLAFALSIVGNSSGGAAGETDGLTNPYTILPATGGLGVSLTVGFGNIPGQTTQTLYLNLNDPVNPSTVAWGWALDVVALSLP